MKLIRLVPTLIAAIAAAQPAPVTQTSPTVADSKDQVPRFGLTVIEIEVPVTVLDRDGAVINGLQPRHFRLFDNGKEQDIRVSTSFHPLSLVLCVQANASMEAVLPQIQKIGSLLETIVVGDQGEAAVIAFDHRIQTLTGFTSEVAKISEVLKKVRPGSSSARQIDAIQSAVRMLKNRPKERRRVILSIAETRDIASEARMREALAEAQLANVTIYAVNVSRMITTLTGRQQPPRPDPLPPAARSMPTQVPATPETVAQKSGLQGGSANFVPLLIEIFRDVKAVFIDNHAEAFTKATGGKEYSFVRQRALEQAVADIGEEIHSQYMITYTPDPKTQLEGGFHEIKVDVSFPGARWRAKPGYWLAARNEK